MLCEASGVGATRWLGAIPRPGEVPWSRWLQTFPSYGFLLAVPARGGAQVCDAFAARGLAAAVVGRFDPGRRLTLQEGDGDAGARALVWDLGERPLTGFAGGGRRA
jgi:hypothetical protein